MYNSANLPAEICWYDANDIIQRMECFLYSDKNILIQESILDFYGGHSFFKEFDFRGKILRFLHKKNGVAISEEISKYDKNDNLLMRDKYQFTNGEKYPIRQIVFSTEN